MKIVVNKPSVNFTMVPNEVFSLVGTVDGGSTRLSPDTLGVLCFIMSKPDGFELRVGEICEWFALGKDKWRRIRKELESVGSIAAVKGGLKGGETMQISWPILAEKQRLPENPAAGKPDDQPAGNPTINQRGTRPQYKKYKTCIERGCKTRDQTSAMRALANPGTCYEEIRQIEGWLKAQGVDYWGMDQLRDSNRKRADLAAKGLWDEATYGPYSGHVMPE